MAITTTGAAAPNGNGPTKPWWLDHPLKLVLDEEGAVKGFGAGFWTTEAAALANAVAHSPLNRPGRSAWKLVRYPTEFFRVPVEGKVEYVPWPWGKDVWGWRGSEIALIHDLLKHIGVKKVGRKEDAGLYVYSRDEVRLPSEKIVKEEGRLAIQKLQLAKRERNVEAREKEVDEKIQLLKRLGVA